MVRRKNGQLVELVILYARKRGGCKGTGPPEISINVILKSCKSCTLTSVTCRKILFYACAACSFARQLLKRLRTPKVFSFVCTPHAKKKPKCTPKIFGPKCMECRLGTGGCSIEGSTGQPFVFFIISSSSFLVPSSLVCLCGASFHRLSPS